MFDLYDIWVFVLLIEIITIAKLFITVHFFFFILQHDKQTLSYIHTKFEGNKNYSFFLQFVLWGHPGFFAPTLKTTLASEVDVPVITWSDSG